MDYKKLIKAIVDMDEESVRMIITTALSNKITPDDLLKKGLIPGMQEIGNLFARKEYFVPEVLLASEAFYAGFNIVSPLLSSQNVRSKGKIVMGVIEGDIHDIGKNIVRVMFEAAGYRVIDLGNDVPVGKFIETIEKEKPDILALSSLMTTTMIKMADVISALRDNRIRDKVKVIIGGAPVTREFADRIGADGYGDDAAEAVQLIEKIHGG